METDRHPRIQLWGRMSTEAASRPIAFALCPKSTPEVRFERLGRALARLVHVAGMSRAHCSFPNCVAALCDCAAAQALVSRFLCAARPACARPR